MLVKEIRIQGPNLPRITVTIDNVKVLTRSGATENVIIRAQREAHEAKIATGTFNLKTYKVEIMTFFRAAVCTFTGSAISKTIDSVRDAKTSDTSELIRYTLQTLKDPLTFVEALGTPKPKL